jgi:hypothetical protein
MSEKNGTSAKPDVNALRAEIKQTRSDLGETVQALAAKADVKARAKDQVEQTKQKVKAQVAEASGRVRDAALVASDKVRHVASSATDVADAKAHDATEQVRRNPIPLAAVLAGVATVIGVILVLRGRRR